MPVNPRSFTEIAETAERWRDTPALPKHVRLLASTVCQMARDLEITPAPPPIFREILIDLMEYLTDEVAGQSRSARGAERTP